MEELNLLNTDIENGVLGRKENNKRYIIRLLSKSKEAMSIPEIAEKIDVSIPACTKIIKELMNDDYLIKDGKKTSYNGRRPYGFTINRNKFFVIGVEILSQFIHLSVVDTNLKTHYEKVNRNFKLTYDKKTLENITFFIEEALQESNISKSTILAIGIGTPNVTKKNGTITTFFSPENISLRLHLQQKIGLPVFVDNDTRTISIAEQAMGIAKGKENVFVIKISRSLGLSIISEKQIITGSSGFAGNFNHTQFRKGTRLCDCGKTGCLGTMIGGNALLEDLKEALLKGEISVYFTKEKISEYTYHDILDAVLKGDELSIKLIENQGIILGEAIGNIINIFDPELVVIDGEYVMVKEFFIDPIKIGVRKTRLITNNGKFDLQTSSLGRYLGSKAGACLALKACQMIDLG